LRKGARENPLDAIKFKKTTGIWRRGGVCTAAITKNWEKPKVRHTEQPTTPPRN